MRFVLDEDVDARLRKDIEAAGHDCWTVPQSGLSSEEDPNLSVYAHNQRAALVTNDKAFSQRVKKRVFGHHVYLACDDVLAREILNLHLDDVVALLERHQDLYLSVSRERIEIAYATWT